jgi:hypothetical protein
MTGALVFNGLPTHSTLSSRFSGEPIAQREGARVPDALAHRNRTRRVSGARHQCQYRSCKASLRADMRASYVVAACAISSAVLRASSASEAICASFWQRS